MKNSKLNILWDHLKKKDDFYSLAIFRIGFGIVMMVEVL